MVRSSSPSEPAVETPSLCPTFLTIWNSLALESRLACLCDDDLTIEICDRHRRGNLRRLSRRVYLNSLAAAVAQRRVRISATADLNMVSARELTFIGSLRSLLSGILTGSIVGYELDPSLSRWVLPAHSGRTPATSSRKSRSRSNSPRHASRKPRSGHTSEKALKPTRSCGTSPRESAAVTGRNRCRTSMRQQGETTEKESGGFCDWPHVAAGVPIIFLTRTRSSAA